MNIIKNDVLSKCSLTLQLFRNKLLNPENFNLDYVEQTSDSLYIFSIEYIAKLSPLVCIS
jgi:DNA-dependent RNA polymerase auxiliary subunit epsilon